MVGVDEHDDVVVARVLEQPAVVIAVLGPGGEGPLVELQEAPVLAAEVMHAEPPAHRLDLVGVALVQQPQVELAVVDDRLRGPERPLRHLDRFLVRDDRGEERDPQPGVRLHRDGVPGDQAGPGHGHHVHQQEELHDDRAERHPAEQHYVRVGAERVQARRHVPAAEVGVLGLEDQPVDEADVQQHQQAGDDPGEQPFALAAVDGPVLDLVGLVPAGALQRPGQVAELVVVVAGVSQFLIHRSAGTAHNHVPAVLGDLPRRPGLAGELRLGGGAQAGGAARRRDAAWGPGPGWGARRGVASCGSRGFQRGRTFCGARGSRRGWGRPAERAVPGAAPDGSDLLPDPGPGRGPRAAGHPGSGRNAAGAQVPGVTRDRYPGRTGAVARDPTEGSRCAGSRCHARESGSGRRCARRSSWSQGGCGR